MALGRCELCERAEVSLTRHHLVPRTRHSNKLNKKLFDRVDVVERIALLCRPCHKMIHALFTEKQLEREFNTLAALRAQGDVARFVDWIRTKPPGFHSYTRKKS